MVGRGQTEAKHVGRSQIIKGIARDARFGLPGTLLDWYFSEVLFFINFL